MSYLLFFTWLIVLSWCLTNIRFVKNAGLGNQIIIAIFLLKVATGLAAGWLTHTDPHADTWNYHQDALLEYKLLFSHPKEFFTNLFYSGYSNGYAGMMQTQNSYWNDLKLNLIVKLVSIFHIFSGGNYYTNVILYNFLIFFGHIGLYRIFKTVYDAENWLLVVVVFLLPSLLFYSSTIHKDGLMLAAIGVILFNVHAVLQQARFEFKRILFVVPAFLLLFLFRNFIVFAMLPALLAMIIAYKKKYSPVKVFAIVYLLSGIVFFNMHRIISSVDPATYMVQKQAAFLELQKGNTSITISKLEPSFTSYLNNAPQALQHSLCRPFITDVSLSRLLLPLSLELVFYAILILLFFFFKKQAAQLNTPFALFGLFFGITVCMIIGYTVPVIGAIVRYRSIYLPFLLAPFIFNTDWKRLRKLL